VTRDTKARGAGARSKEQETERREARGDDQRAQIRGKRQEYCLRSCYVFEVGLARGKRNTKYRFVFEFEVFGNFRNPPIPNLHLQLLQLSTICYSIGLSGINRAAYEDNALFFLYPH